MDSKAFITSGNTLIAIEAAVADIVRMHGENTDAARATLDRAILIGERLATIKSQIPHGTFGDWCEANLPFSARTARNYLRCYRERDRIKTATVADLTSAYQFLTTPKPLASSHSTPSPASDSTHNPEDWEPAAGEIRIGQCPDGRTVVLDALPDGLFVRYAVMAANFEHIDFQKRGLNRSYLRFALRLDGIDPDDVDWWESRPSSAENNPFISALPWTYETEVAA